MNTGIKYLIRHELNPYHVSLNAVTEFEEAILASDPDIQPIYRSRLSIQAGKILNRALRSRLSWRPIKSIWRRFGLSEGNSFSLAILMGPRFQKCLPQLMRTEGRIVYLFDAWPKYHHYIRTALDQLEVQIAFVSSRQASDRLNRQAKFTRYYWLPEGVSPDNYQASETDHKTVDLIQLGRKHVGVHQQILKGTDRYGWKYLYERHKGDLVAPNQDEFAYLLGQSRISICIPSALSDPDRSGDISTMTTRYLQSMASRCLVVGIQPDEMTQLFDYNPMIELDLRDPVGQIAHLLDQFDQYQSLIERNYQTVRELHTWQNRYSKMKSILAEI